MQNVYCCLIIFYLFIPVCLSWDADDLALFDVVEDVNKNFYELLELKEDATASELRKAYRRLSLQLHPDRNKEKDAEDQFRKLVSVYEILKDENLRKKYDEVLVNGLPDWRQPIYYYRKVKKMGLIDLALFLSVVLTLGHYLVMWSAYYERKFELEQIFKPKKKKDKKARKGKDSKAIDNEDDGLLELPEELTQLMVKPTFLDILPVVVIKSSLSLFTVHIPYAFSYAFELMTRKKMDEEDIDENEFDDRNSYRQKTVRNATPASYQLAEHSQAINYTKKTDEELFKIEDHVKTAKKTGEEWSEHELSLLVKAIIKFPGGTAERWDKIACMVGRSTKEVMVMVKKFKSTQVMSEMNAKVVVRKGASQMTLDHVQTSTIDPADRNNLEIKENLSSVSSQKSQWTQEQQKSLEAAMQKIDKKLLDRWDQIASLVEGKSKSECLQRVKYLSTLVKKKKNEEMNS